MLDYPCKHGVTRYCLVCENNLDVTFMAKGYKAGKYKIIEEARLGIMTNNEIFLKEKIYYLDLTSAQAKVMFEIYNKLGIKEIEYMGDN